MKIDQVIIQILNRLRIREITGTGVGVGASWAWANDCCQPESVIRPNWGAVNFWGRLEAACSLTGFAA